MFHAPASQPTGFVSFIGGGPGAADLITIRGQRALGSADIVLHDELPGRELLAFCHPDAEIVSVGKRAGGHSAAQEEINGLLIHHARLGKRVARLKGGDPTVFGRLGEEVAALRAEEIDFEIIPGVTAACAAAAAAGISLTQRGIASTAILTTGHECAGKREPSVDWTALAQRGATLCVYMGTRALGSIALRLAAGGLPVDTPVLIISHASRPTQVIRSGTLADASDLAAEAEDTPSLIVIGEAAALHRRSSAQHSSPALAHVAS